MIVSDPELIKQTFRADPTVLHAGTASPLRELLGENSMLGIDEEQHMEQRKLLLPSFKGQRMREYEPMIAEIAAEEIDGWPQDVEFEAARAMQRITLRAILRAVFGAEGAQLQTLEELIPRWTALGSRVSLSPELRRNLGPWAPWPKFQKLRRRIDEVLAELIALAKADPELEARADVLALMVQARHEDGTPMSNAELCDELVTMLVAGHETTSNTLSWAMERLRRHPQIVERLVEEVDAGGKALREATIREVQRSRPVIAFAGRYTRKPFELGGYRLPVRTRILLAACLTHYDPTAVPAPRPLPARPLPRHAARHLLVDPLRRRYPPLHRRHVRAHGDGRRAARAARTRRAPAHRRPARAMGVSWRRLGARRGRADDGAPTRGHLRLGRE